MGHVPPGEVSVDSQGADLPRREHRGSRPARNPHLASRPGLGAFGEQVACEFLEKLGLDVVARNLRIGGGEIDLLAIDGRERVLVEVRTLSRSRTPLDAVDHAKRLQVKKLAAVAGATRRDLVGIGVFPGFLVVHWSRAAF